MIIPLPDNTPLTDDSPCPIRGKYYGRPMKAVPSNYLDWVRNQPHLLRKYPLVAAYIAKSAKAIDQDLERDEQQYNDWESW